jgi:hypothetical protein
LGVEQFAHHGYVIGLRESLFDRKYKVHPLWRI